MEKILNSLKQCREIQNFPAAKLEQLAGECRDRIIDVVSRKGGHLASSLGAVELTVALAKAFNLEEDKVVWDVGHQAYTYKLLTGRNDQFEKLGQKGGLAKFTSRKESKYDHFGVGHASTSISATLGISIARDLKKEDYRTIAVIGDGSMTGGLAYEALNHAGHLDENMIVILNDNEMSIDPVVGALSKTITNITSSKSFAQARAEFIKHTHGGNLLPKSIKKGLNRINESLMAFFTKGIWFEKFNFRYFGQIDGHDINKLVSILKVIRKVKGPVLLHVNTKKGKGYSFAEDNAAKFHGVSPFNLVNGRLIPKVVDGKSYTSVWSETFEQIMASDPKVMGISAAMLAGTGLLELEKKFPKRILDVGIAESHAVTMAAGMATQGLKPFVVIYSTFLQRAFDNLVHDVALQNLPVRFILDRAGLVGPDGATHHGALDLTYLRMIPNMMILAPRNGTELQAMLKFAHQYESGPLAIRFPRDNTTEFQEVNSENLPEILPGKGELLKQGEDVAIFAVGTMVKVALDVSKKLEVEGITVAVVNCRFIKPLDENLILETAGRVKKLISIEENSVVGGFGSAILELLNKKGIFMPTLQLGMPDSFIEQASRKEQLEDAGLDVDSVALAVKKFFLD